MDNKSKTNHFQSQESAESAKDLAWSEALREIKDQREKDKSDVESFKRKASDFLIFRARSLVDKKTNDR